MATGYRDATCMAIAWCELRPDFRMFRLDRIVAIDFLDERYPDRPAALRQRWITLIAVRDAEQQNALPPLNAR